MKHDEHDYRAEELVDRVEILRSQGQYANAVREVAQALRDAERYGASQAGKAKRAKRGQGDG